VDYISLAGNLIFKSIKAAPGLLTQLFSNLLQNVSSVHDRSSKFTDAILIHSQQAAKRFSLHRSKTVLPQKMHPFYNSPNPSALPHFFPQHPAFCQISTAPGVIIPLHNITSEEVPNFILQLF